MLFFLLRIDNKFIFIVFIFLLQTETLCTIVYIQACSFFPIFLTNENDNWVSLFYSFYEISLRFELTIFCVLIWKSIKENYGNLFLAFYNDDLFPQQKSIYVNKVVVLKTLMVLFNFHIKSLMLIITGIVLSLKNGN